MSFTNKLQPVSGKIIIKLENLPIRKTKSGIIYDESVKNERNDYRYGHIYSINEEESNKYNLKIGDRVLFLLCYFDPITFRSISQKNYIPLVLLCGEPEGILCKADEEMTVLDW